MNGNKELHLSQKEIKYLESVIQAQRDSLSVVEDSSGVKHKLEEEIKLVDRLEKKLSSGQ